MHPGGQGPLQHVVKDLEIKSSYDTMSVLFFVWGLLFEQGLFFGRGLFFENGLVVDRYPFQ